MINVKTKLDMDNECFEVVKLKTKNTSTMEMLCLICRLFDEIHENTDMERKEIYKLLHKVDKVWSDENAYQGE